MENRIPQQGPYRVNDQPYSVSPRMVTTAFEPPGYRIHRNLGVVRGIVVRSRSIVANTGAFLQTIVGGNITAWTKLCEQTRKEAFDIMVQHATGIGADAIIGARYDATEVLAYGAAVIVEPLEESSYLK